MCARWERKREVGSSWGPTCNTRKDDFYNIQHLMKARRPAAGSVGRGVKFKKKTERQLGLDSFAWEHWKVFPAPPPTFDYLRMKHKLLNAGHKTLTMKPQHTFTATAPAFDPSRHAPAFAFTTPCFLTSSL